MRNDLSRLEELLADAALEGLGANEAAELHSMGVSVGVLGEEELAAAAAALAWLNIESMPAPIAARLEEHGEKWAAARRVQSTN